MKKKRIKRIFVQEGDGVRLNSLGVQKNSLEKDPPSKIAQTLTYLSFYPEKAQQYHFSCM